MQENSIALLWTGLTILGHIHETTADTSNEQKIQGNHGEIEKSPWSKDGISMYKRDKYARDRVMKSARLLLPYLNPDDKNPSTILDVGCFTWEARKYFPRSVKYIGIDQEKYHPKTQVVDLNHGFEPIPCQLALCLETLEHLVDPYDTLQSIVQSLVEGGHLVVSLPNEATLFHRLRALLGTVDGDCFAGEGKHLHLPSKAQTLRFLGKFPQLELVRFLTYISPTAQGSKQEWVGRILGSIPDSIHQALADWFPSLFARGFIFLLKKVTPDNKLTQAPEQSQPS